MRRSSIPVNRIPTGSAEGVVDNVLGDEIFLLKVGDEPKCDLADRDRYRIPPPYPLSRFHPNGPKVTHLLEFADGNVEDAVEAKSHITARFPRPPSLPPSPSPKVTRLVGSVKSDIKNDPYDIDADADVDDRYTAEAILSKDLCYPHPKAPKVTRTPYLWRVLKMLQSRRLQLDILLFLLLPSALVLTPESLGMSEAIHPTLLKELMQRITLTLTKALIHVYGIPCPPHKVACSTEPVEGAFLSTRDVKNFCPPSFRLHPKGSKSARPLEFAMQILLKV